MPKELPILTTDAELYAASGAPASAALLPAPCPVHPDVEPHIVGGPGKLPELAGVSCSAHLLCWHGPCCRTVEEAIAQWNRVMETARPFGSGRHPEAVGAGTDGGRAA